MAQRILGLDIGAHSVKAILLEAGLRSFEARRFEEQPFPPKSGEAAQEEGEEEQQQQPQDDEDSWFERLGQALAGLKERLGSAQHDVCVTAIPGERVSVRLIRLPFTRAREIEMVLGQEVEEYIPFKDLDAVAYEHMVLSTEGGSSQILVATCPRLFLEKLLQVLDQHGFDPRQVGVGGMGAVQLTRAMLPQQTGPTAVVDIGRGGTTICVVSEGKPLLLRTLKRGAHHLVRKLAQVYQVDELKAEAALRSDVEILPPHSAMEHHPERLRISELMREGIRPIIQGIRQTLLAFTGLHGLEVKELYLCGGLSLLPGLDRHIGAALDLPVRGFELGSMAWMKVAASREQEARVTEALSLALSGLPQSREEQINFRGGPFAFQGGYQFIRGKVISIAMVISLLILGLGFYVWSAAEDLGSQERLYLADLKARTQVLLGEALDNPETAIARMRRTQKGSKYDIVPKQSAYDLFHEVSRVMPMDVQVDLEKLNIDLDRHRVEIRGRTTSATAVERIVEALDRIPCFTRGIEKEKNEKTGSEGKQLFVLSIKMSC